MTESQSSATTEFAKELGLKESIAIAAGAMIGGGIFTALGNLSKITGPAASVSFLLGGFIATLTAHSYFRLVNKYPSAGGEFVILRRGFSNPFIGDSVGIMLWFGYSVTIALYAFTFGNYTTEFIFGITGIHFFDIHNTNVVNGRKVMSAISILLFMWLNLRGVKETGTVQNIIVMFKVFVLLFVSLIGLALFKPERYDPFTITQDAAVASLGGLSPIGGIVIGSAVAFVSYEGFQVIANTVEEMENPAKDVKRGMFISVISVTIIYFLTTVSTFSLVNDINDINETALIEAVRFLGTWAVLLITLGAAASTTSAINATLLGSSRLAYVMSDWGSFPKSLAKLNPKTQVPARAIIATSLFSWLLTFFGSAAEIAESGSLIFLGIFLAINLAVLKIFPEQSNNVAKLAAVLITSYMLLVTYFFITHWEISRLAILVLIIFSTATVLWLVIKNKFLDYGEADVEKYTLEPLGKDLIPRFKITQGIEVDEYFTNMSSILMPASGKSFERQTWNIATLISLKYNAELTILTVGKSDTSDLEKFAEERKVKYRFIRLDNGDIASAILKVQSEQNFDLICMASKRRDRVIDRLFERSVSKKVANRTVTPVLQVHPPDYNKDRDLIDQFILLDGSSRDLFIARWAKLITASGNIGKIYAYHMQLIPQTISVEDAIKLPEVQKSSLDFERYATDLGEQLGLNVHPIFLVGHNFKRSLIDQIKRHEPDVVLIGHSRDKGIRDRIRTHLSYQILNHVRPAIIVSHTEEELPNIKQS